MQTDACSALVNPSTQTRCGKICCSARRGGSFEKTRVRATPALENCSKRQGAGVQLCVCACVCVCVCVRGLTSSSNRLGQPIGVPPARTIRATRGLEESLGANPCAWGTEIDPGLVPPFDFCVQPPGWYVRTFWLPGCFVNQRGNC